MKVMVFDEDLLTYAIVHNFLRRITFLRLMTFEGDGLMKVMAFIIR